MLMGDQAAIGNPFFFAVLELTSVYLSPLPLEEICASFGRLGDFLLQIFERQTLAST
jgi:hypothetical protein